MPQLNSKLPIAALFLSLAAFSSTARAAPIGLGRIELPDGLRSFEPKLSAQLLDGAQGLRGLTELKSSCTFDEPACAAGEAREAKLEEIVQGRVKPLEGGFSFELQRLSAVDGRVLQRSEGAVEGGPLDLASGMEHGMCELLGGGKCQGTLRVDGEVSSGDSSSSGANVNPLARRGHVLVDGTDRGELPLASLPLSVGRHKVQLDGLERRVRIAYGRETRLDAANNLADTGAAVASAKSAAPLQTSLSNGNTRTIESARLPAAPLIASSSPPPLSSEAKAGRITLAAGGALLATAAGLELYALAQSGALDHRYQAGQLTSADAPSYGHVQAAGVTAAVLASLGGAALLGGGVLLWLSPNGVGGSS